MARESLSENFVILAGGVGTEPDLFNFKDGNQNYTFQLCTPKSYISSKTKKRVSHDVWHKVVVRQKNLIKVLNTHVKKGSQLYIKGEIDTQKWKDKTTGKMVYQQIVVPFLVKFNGVSPGSGTGFERDEDEYNATSEHDAENRTGSDASVNLYANDELNY